MDKDLKLDKGLSQINVWSLAMGSIIGSSAFFMPGSIFLPQAGPLGTAIGMIIGAFINNAWFNFIFATLQILIFTYLINKKVSGDKVNRIIYMRSGILLKSNQMN